MKKIAVLLICVLLAGAAFAQTRGKNEVKFLKSEWDGYDRVWENYQKLPNNDINFKDHINGDKESLGYNAEELLTAISGFKKAEADKAQALIRQIQSAARAVNPAPDSSDKDFQKAHYLLEVYSYAFKVIRWELNWKRNDADQAAHVIAQLEKAAAVEKLGRTVYTDMMKHAQ